MRFALIVFLKSAKRYNILFPVLQQAGTKLQQALNKGSTAHHKGLNLKIASANV